MLEKAPEALCEYLVGLSKERLQRLYDRDADYDPYEAGVGNLAQEEGEEEEEEEEDNVEGQDEETTNDLEQEPINYSDEEDYIVEEDDYNQKVEIKRPRMAPEEHSIAVEKFKEMLLEREDLDPFKAWESISTQLSGDPRFQAIATDKERRSLFESLCPELAGRARIAREKLQSQAEEEWKDTLERLTLAHAPATWTEYSRRIRKETWYKLLNPKKMEKEYRARLSELRTRSMVYQIPQ